MFKRFANLMKGFFGLFVTGLEKKKPEALLELERENLRKQIAQYNQGLAAHAGLCERLITQVNKLETDERELRAKTTALLRVNNREAAGQTALRLQTVQRELAENRTQAEQAEKTYQELRRARDVAIKNAQAKIEALRFSLDDLKIKKATAELNEMAAGMITQIGGSGDTLARLQTLIEEERQSAAGRARVARDSLDISGVALKEAEQKALEEQALADFAANEGITVQSNQAPEKPEEGGSTKTMGPLKE
ncbi:MAG: PspA/IM30 family protein [Verrucomicrobia bacterium]|nr:PspA/IM30 family protein [Verrucomicrobiota bacterium]